MCMGTTHARHGLAAAATAAALLPPTPVPTLAVLIIAATGAAILPDIDHPEATIAHTFGPLSHAVSRAVHATSEVLYRATATHYDQDRDGGHRGFTHTVLFAGAAGGAAYAALYYGGHIALGVLTAVLASFALHSLTGAWARRWGWLATTALAAILGGAAYFFSSPPPLSMGAAVALGSLVHCAGDMLTVQGCPLLWPMPLRGQRWRMLGTPTFMRFRTRRNSRAEAISGWVALGGALVIVGYLTW